MGDNSLHFHLLYDPGTNHCSTLGLFLILYKGQKRTLHPFGGWWGGLSIALVIRAARGGEAARPGLSQKPHLAKASSMPRILLNSYTSLKTLSSLFFPSGSLSCSLCWDFLAKEDSSSWEVQAPAGHYGLVNCALDCAPLWASL